MAKRIKSLTTRLLTESAAIDVTDFTLGMPLYVVLGEAIDVAAFTQHYWRAVRDPKTKAVTLPGLELAGDANLSSKIVDEILVLHDLLQKAQTAYVLSISPPTESTERAEYVLGELASAIEWVCNQPEADENHVAKLAAIVEAHKDDAGSEDALASEIADYVGLAIDLEDELSSVGAFDASLVEEAQSHVAALRQRSAARIRGRGGEASVHLRERNQLASLLLGRIGHVRAAARYVFRHHEAIVRQVTSSYQRRRRTAARRRTSEATTPSPSITTSPSTTVQPSV